MAFQILGTVTFTARTLFVRKFKGDCVKALRLTPRADRLLELRPACTAGLLVKLIA